MRIALASFASSLLVASNAFAQVAAPGAPTPAPTAPAVLAPTSPGDLHLDLATLDALRNREQITQAEYDAAVRDLNDTTGAAIAGKAPTFALGKFSTTLYGAIKGDMIYDSTESYGDLAGNTLVQRPNGSPLPPPPSPQITYAGSHSRMQFSIHDTRFGFYMRAPEVSGIRASGLLEMDLFGQIASNASEAQSFSSSVPRVRHAYVRVETPIVDVLVGQYWHLFGWQNVYHPASVEAQGLVGEVYSRDMQIRISKTIKTEALTFEIAAAALRPPARDSGKPQGEAGMRLAFNKWTGMMTNGALGTSLQPLSLAVTGNFRDITIPELELQPKDSVDLGMGSIAGDVLIPVIPATKEKKDNALTIHGEAVYGNGSSDLYTSLTGGMTFPYVPNTTNINPAPTYPQDIDNGIVAFDLTGNLHAIQWTSFLGGLQYYVPATDGRLFVTATYSHMQSDNIADFTSNVAPNPLVRYYTASGATTRKSIDYFNASLFGDVTMGVRVGLQCAYTLDHYVDGTQAKNVRGQLAGMFIF